MGVGLTADLVVEDSIIQEHLSLGFVVYICIWFMHMSTPKIAERYHWGDVCEHG